jgi:glycosyltransferase involved in cell wall biosynthesis
MAIALAEMGYLVLYGVFIDSPDDVETFREIRPNLVLCRAPAQVFHGLDEAVMLSYAHNYPWVKRAQAKRILYELIDKFEIWPDFPIQVMRSYHRQLLARATVVAGTATDLMAELTPTRPDALLCPNGVDYAHFAPSAEGDAPPTPEDMRELVARGKPIIGYYGALAEWFDYDLLAKVARALPDYEFALIGPEYDLKLAETAIHGVENIHWLGAKPYAALPAYLRCFSVATIPFVVNDAINAVSPIKLFEYMAGGKPIVTSDLVECRKYPVVLRATTPDEWVARLREAVALGHDSDYLARLDATARENTWQARARLLTAALAVRERLDRAPVAARQ